MAVEFQLPEIGEGVMEGEIVEWHVSPGDQVTEDQPLVAMLTDKATIEIASTFSGVVDAIHGEPGDVVEVGKLLLTYTDSDEPAEASTPEPAPKNAGQAKSEAPEATGALEEFKLPEIGEGVMEGEIVEWHVSPGDQVSQDSPVLSILTDKATVEITAHGDGTVLEVKGQPGDILEVGEVIMKLRTAGGAAPAPEEAAAKPAPKPEPSAPAKSAAAPDPRVPIKDNPSISAFGTPLATPAVRKWAAQEGLDLRAVRGSGPNHRITRADVEAALKAGPAAPTPKASQAPAGIGAGERREKIRGLRKAIVASMSKSKSIIPHFTYVEEVEMDQLVAMRSQLKPVAQEAGVKLTYLPFICKAVVQALRKFPILNAMVDDEAGEIVYHGDYNLGIATATEAGLTVPVLKHANQKTIVEIAGEIAELSDRARNKRSTMEDISGGTFTITSLGRLGGLFTTPIINHPEVAIVGVNKIMVRPVWDGSRFVPRKMMNLSSSFDHRVIDGWDAAVFVQRLKELLETPATLFVDM